ncbi:MAG: extracellular solute-binding protein, partial [Candidatus Rokubacteria bacterium]|nr:extracellular solute-binding protein [Candidatus Rokubacteria bacterium]
MNRRTFLVSGSAAGSALALGLGRPRRAFAAKTLRLLTPEADPSQIKMWNALFEDYTAKKNKDVVIKGEFAKWDDITKKLAADIAAGKPPELVAGSSKPDFVAAEAKRGLVVDLAPVVDALGRRDFNPAALKVWQYRG